MAKVLDVAKYFLLLNQRLNDSIKREDDNNDDFETTPDPIVFKNDSLSSLKDRIILLIADLICSMGFLKKDLNL